MGLGVVIVNCFRWVAMGWHEKIEYFVIKISIFLYITFRIQIFLALSGKANGWKILEGICHTYGYEGSLKLLLHIRKYASLFFDTVRIRYIKQYPTYF